MNLYILRHALAGERGSADFPDDSKRPLTPKGERKTRLAAQAMKKLGISFDHILSSPYLRAAQTAEIVAAGLKARKRLAYVEALTPDGRTYALLETISRLDPSPKSVLLVGHEPALSGLISLLVSGDSRCMIELKKGALCKLSVERMKAGRCATLEWLLTAKQMALMAR